MPPASRGRPETTGLPSQTQRRAGASLGAAVEQRHEFRSACYRAGGSSTDPIRGSGCLRARRITRRLPPSGGPTRPCAVMAPSPSCPCPDRSPHGGRSPGGGFRGIPRSQKCQPPSGLPADSLLLCPASLARPRPSVGEPGDQGPDSTGLLEATRGGAGQGCRSPSLRISRWGRGDSRGANTSGGPLGGQRGGPVAVPRWHLGASRALTRAALSALAGGALAGQVRSGWGMVVLSSFYQLGEK